MKVLFVCSGNSDNGLNVIIENQGLSLIKEGVLLDYFTIKGKGIKSYVKYIFKLHHHIRNNSYDIIHAHYSFSAIVALLAGEIQLSCLCWEVMFTPHFHGEC